MSQEKLRILLDEGHESALLDYKSTLDLNRTKDVVELAKDIGAMQVDGGYIVVGADDNGNPTGALTQAQATLFDEATVRAKVRRWIPEPLDLLSASHEIDGASLALVYVGPSPEGLCIFAADGNDGEGGTAFRQGDVYVRHGTASERWQQPDIRRIFERRVQALKDAWRAELREVIRSLSVAGDAQQLAMGPAPSLTWQIDEEGFAALIIIELLRRREDIPIRLFLDKVARDASDLLSSNDRHEELETLLDRVTCYVAICVNLERFEEAQHGIRTLVGIYNLGFNVHGSWATEQSYAPPQLWLAIIERVLSLGALAVRKRYWSIVRDLVLQKGSGHDFEHYTSWLRHAQVMAARSDILSCEEDDRRIELSLLTLAQNHIRRLDCLRPDIGGDDEQVLNSLCQFDILASLTAIADAESLDSSVFYTNFARFYSHRSEPALVGLLTDNVMRETLFPLSDPELAIALRRVNSMAIHESFRYAGWHGFSDHRIKQFLEEHPPPE